jgi:Family of unknown function (DUF6488)
MKIFTSLFLLLVVLGTQQALAHSDHQHDPISDAKALTLATEVSTQLSSKDTGLEIGQLPTSWGSIPEKNASIYKKGKGYIIVSVLNNNEKKTLYVLMSQGGDVYDANFSGTFKGIE